MFKRLLIVFAFLVQITAYGQLANGSTAPDFTLTDYYGTEHNLYAYLDEGKTVFVEIFAVHCPSCWSYHQTHTLKNLYNTYGPDGTNELMVLTLEHDEGNTHNSFIGEGADWATQGNWLEGTPFPIFNVEGPDRSVFDDYNVIGYPVVYKVCPNRIVERVFTSATVDQLYEKVQECQATLSIDETLDLGNIYFDPISRNLNIDKFQEVRTIRVISLTGKMVQTMNAIDASAIAIDPLQPGIYLFEIQTDNGTVVRKFFLD